MKKIVAGMSMMGQAPEGGYLVEVTPKDMMSETISAALIDWLRNSVLIRFGPETPVHVMLVIKDPPKL